MTTDSFYRVLFIIGIYFTDSHCNSHIYPEFIKCNADRYKEIPFKLFPFIAVTLYYYCSGWCRWCYPISHYQLFNGDNDEEGGHPHTELLITAILWIAKDVIRFKWKDYPWRYQQPSPSDRSKSSLPARRPAPYTDWYLKKKLNEGKTNNIKRLFLPLHNECLEKFFTCFRDGIYIVRTRKDIQFVLLIRMYSMRVVVYPGKTHKHTPTPIVPPPRHVAPSPRPASSATVTARTNNGQVTEYFVTFQ